MNDLISRSALLADIEDTVVISARNTISTEMRGIHKVTDRIKAASAVDAVEIGSCEGCMWENRERPQKCSCCRRNPDIKDCYGERRTE